MLCEGIQLLWFYHLGGGGWIVTFGFSLDSTFTSKRCAVYAIIYMGDVPIVKDESGVVPVALAVERDTYLMQTVPGAYCRAPFQLPGG